MLALLFSLMDRLRGPTFAGARTVAWEHARGPRRPPNLEEAEQLDRARDSLACGWIALAQGSCRALTWPELQEEVLDLMETDDTYRAEHARTSEEDWDDYIRRRRVVPLVSELEIIAASQKLQKSVFLYDAETGRETRRVMVDGGGGKGARRSEGPLLPHHCAC